MTSTIPQIRPSQDYSRAIGAPHVPPVPIPFNRPWRAPKEREYVEEALAGRVLSGNGPFTKRCEAALSPLLGGGEVLLTTSCTDALEMCALLMDIKPGDEVILPSFTFVSTVNAFVLRGAIPVFCDIHPDTKNIDERLIAGLITPRTKAVIVVHYAGIGCAMEAIAALCTERGIVLIEDNAHGLTGTYQGRPLGNFGALATVSFHETKNISCGEGGALVINDPALRARAEILWEKGTNRSQFFRGQVDKYGWVDIGSSFLPSEVTAALLLSQLDAIEHIQRRRRSIWMNYFRQLERWATRHGVELPTIPSDCGPSWHLFYLIMPSLADRTRFIAYLKSAGISAPFHYVPLHSAPMARRLLTDIPDLRVTDRISDCLVRLPLFTDLDIDDVESIVECIMEFPFDP